MPRTNAYGIADLFALVSRLLAPLVDPLRAEFAVKAIDRPRPTTPPQPTADPAAATPVKQSEPLFVRKPAGKKWRYVVAPTHARGEKFRKLVTGRRVKYEPCL